MKIKNLKEIASQLSLQAAVQLSLQAAVTANKEHFHKIVGWLNKREVPIVEALYAELKERPEGVIRQIIKYGNTALFSVITKFLSEAEKQEVLNNQFVAIDALRSGNPEMINKVAEFFGGEPNFVKALKKSLTYTVRALAESGNLNEFDRIIDRLDVSNEITKLYNDCSYMQQIVSSAILSGNLQMLDKVIEIAKNHNKQESPLEYLKGSPYSDATSIIYTAIRSGNPEMFDKVIELFGGEIKFKDFMQKHAELNQIVFFSISSGSPKMFDKIVNFIGESKFRDELSQNSSIDLAIGIQKSGNLAMIDKIENLLGRTDILKHALQDHDFTADFALLLLNNTSNTNLALEKEKDNTKHEGSIRQLPPPATQNTDELIEALKVILSHNNYELVKQGIIRGKNRDQWGIVLKALGIDKEQLGSFNHSPSRY